MLRKLSSTDRLRVLRAIVGLGESPRPVGCRKLSGFDDVFRIRVGRFRVLYAVEDRRLVVIAALDERSAIGPGTSVR